MYVRLLKDVSQSTYAVYIFGSSCISFEMVSIAISLDLRFFSSALSNLPLILPGTLAFSFLEI